MNDPTAYQKIASLPERVRAVLEIIKGLESDFPGRKFSLDGHLLGSIGEVIASFYYSIDLSKPSAKLHDGVTADGKKVQIKITTRDSYTVHLGGSKELPEYLIALYLDGDGNIWEVYNGTGELALQGVMPQDSYKNCHVRRRQLTERDSKSTDRLPQRSDVPPLKNIRDKQPE